MQRFWQSTILLLCYAYQAMASGMLRLHLNNKEYEFKVELTNIISLPNGTLYFRIPYNELERKGLPWPIQLNQTNSPSSSYIANEGAKTFNVSVVVDQVQRFFVFADGVTPEAPVYYKREADDKKGTALIGSAEQENSGEGLEADAEDDKTGSAEQENSEEGLEADAEDEDDWKFEATLVRDHTGKWLGAVSYLPGNEQDLKDFAKITYLPIDGKPNFYSDVNVYIVVMSHEEGVAIH